MSLVPVTLSPDLFEKEFFRIFNSDTGLTISPNDSFASLDMDSLDKVELLLMIESHFNLDLPDNFVSLVKINDTLGSLLEKLKVLYYK